MGLLDKATEVQGGNYGKTEKIQKEGTGANPKAPTQCR